MTPAKPLILSIAIARDRWRRRAAAARAACLACSAC